MQRVVVTGIGVVSSVGVGRQQFWEALLEGRCGTGPVESFDTSEYPVHNGAEVKGYDPGGYVVNLDPDRLGRSSAFAIGAARLALEDAGMGGDGAGIDKDLDPQRAAVTMGTASGEPRQIEVFDNFFVDDEFEDVGPEVLDLYPCQVLASHVSRELGLCGGSMVIPAACAAGIFAIAHAWDCLRWDRADVVLAGGADSFSRISYSGFARLMAVSPDVCRPFDRNRKGLIPGEGAASWCSKPRSEPTGAAPGSTRRSPATASHATPTT